MPAKLVPNFLDVVDHRLGLAAAGSDVMRLRESEVGELAELLSEHYDAWSPPPLDDDEVRGFFDLSDVWFNDWHPGMPTPRAPVARLLYLDSIAIPDPVSCSIAVLTGRPLEWRTGRSFSAR